MGGAKVEVIGPFGKQLSVARCATMRNFDDAEGQSGSPSADAAFCGPGMKSDCERKAEVCDHDLGYRDHAIRDDERG
jgi:hypothetical protein